MQAVYDLECYPNCFMAGFRPIGAPPEIGYIFELSDRKNESKALFSFICACSELIGFNNMSYDWPMMSHFLHCYAEHGTVTPDMMWEKNSDIFATHYLDRNKHVIWKPAIPQVDLFLIHHLDRFNVGLKQLEMTMRSPVVMDLPYEPGICLTFEQMNVVVNEYLPNDVRETEKIFLKSKADIDYRRGLGAEWVNYNDGKIGKKFFERELIKAGVKLYNDTKPNDYGRNRKQTRRPHGVALADVVLPLVNFTRDTSRGVLDLVKQQHIAENKTKGGFKTSLDLDGFKIDIGLGGIHGSVNSQSFINHNCRIRDFDVTSYYPSIAIEHKFYPEHLGPKFCEVYETLRRRRLGLSKKDPVRSTLKFALNVPFGSSNDEHSIFFDPKYMLAITLNGQLMLCMLAEQMANAGVKVLQVNTDGVTVFERPGQADAIDKITAWWQGITRMQLEETQYRRMFIRDSVNYLAETLDGERKRIGDYDFVRMRQGISKFFQANHSQMIVPRAAEAAMLDDIDPEDFIRNGDPWDFLLFRKGKLELDGQHVPKNFRYYISETGGALASIFAPLAGKTEPRRIGIHAEGLAHAIGGRKNYTCSQCGHLFTLKSEFEIHNKREHCWKVTPAMVFDGRLPADIDYRYYLAETEKLIIPDPEVCA